MPKHNYFLILLFSRLPQGVVTLYVACQSGIKFMLALLSIDNLD